jgi:hypothetical protein
MTIFRRRSPIQRRPPLLPTLGGTRLYLLTDAAEVDPGAEAEYALGVRERGTGVVSSTATATVAGPTSGVQVQVGGTAAAWISPALEAVTISGTISFNLWAFESAAAANVGLDVKIERCDGSGNVISQIARSERGTELGTSATAQVWTVTPTSTTLSAGDRIKVTVFGNDAGGTMTASARTFTLRYHGTPAGSNGDSFVRFAEILTVASVVPATVDAPSAGAVAAGQPAEVSAASSLDATPGGDVAGASVASVVGETTATTTPPAGGASAAASPAVLSAAALVNAPSGGSSAGGPPHEAGVVAAIDAPSGGAAAGAAGPALSLGASPRPSPGGSVAAGLPSAPPTGSALPAPEPGGASAGAPVASISAGGAHEAAIGGDVAGAGAVTLVAAATVLVPSGGSAAGGANTLTEVFIAAMVSAPAGGASAGARPPAVTAVTLIQGRPHIIATAYPPVLTGRAYPPTLDAAAFPPLLTGIVDD